MQKIEKREIPGMSLIDVERYLTASGRPIQDYSELMNTHGLRPSWDKNHIIPIDTCWRLLSEHSAMIGDEFHAVAEHSLRPGANGLIVARMLLNDTVFGAIQAYCKASYVLVPELEITTSRRHHETVLRWRYLGEYSELKALVMEATAVFYFAVISWLANQQLRVLRAKAPDFRRASASTLMHSFEAPISFDGGSVELVFKTSDLEIPVADKNITTWRDGVGTILTLIAMQVDSEKRVGEFTKRVRAELLNGLGQKQISAGWGMSARTIARRLAQEGSSFKDLRDEVRMHKAVSLIHTDMTVEDIGYQVGYEDPRSFRRAFARWFGTSPSLYRNDRAFI